MKRRSFFKKTTAALMGLGLTTSSFAHITDEKIKKPLQVCTTIDQEKVSFYAEVISESIKVVHIPMYAPGKKIYYGCGNPNWGAATDHGFELERRPKWPESGHTKTTLDFHKEVFNAPNLLGIFTGHIHRNSIEIIKGKPQIVADDNASGGYLNINFLPMKEQDKKLIL